MPILQFRSQNRQRGSMEIKNQTETTADLNIFGDIVSDEWGKWSDDDTCPSDIAEFLKNLDGVDEINLHINSGGGSVYGGIAIYNMLHRSKARVTTYIDGIAASIASVIACAGDRIVMPKNGTFMVHKPSTGYFFTSMNADELRKDADMLDSCQKAIVQVYMNKVKDGVTEETVNNLMNAESWLVGEDVTEYFDFEIEEGAEAVACASDYFGRYQHTPENLRKKKEGEADTEELINKAVEKSVNTIMKRLEDKEKAAKEAEKNEILKDLDLYGV